MTAAKRPLLEILKDWSGLLVGGAALLYIFGFTVHWAYFRLLGIDINAQPLDYLRFAADYSTSIVSSVPQLSFAFEYYSPKLIHSPLSALTFLCALTPIVFVVFCFWRRAKGRKRKAAVVMVLWWSLNVIIVISLYLLLQTEFNVAKVRDILQPVDAADVQQMQNQVTSSAGLDNATLLEVRGKNVTRIYEKYTQTQKGSPGFGYFSDWFNPTVRPHNSAERRAVYLALLLLNLVILFAVILQLWSLRFTDDEDNTTSIRQRIGPRLSVALTLILCSGLLIQIFLFPFVYATLGRNLTYPIVILKLSVPSKEQDIEVRNQGSTPEREASGTPSRTNVGGNDETWTHCVYLIADLDNEVIVFDRLNFFQVKRVPRSRILTISQVFAASPFESCSLEEGKFTPCETLWMSEQTPILDF